MSLSHRLNAALAPYQKPPLQLLDKNFSPITTLNMANLYDGKSLINPSETKDFFYIQYESKELAGKGVIQVKLSSQHPTKSNSIYNNELSVNLYEDPNYPGRYRSAALAAINIPELANASLVGGNKWYNFTKDVSDSGKELAILAELGGNISVKLSNSLTGQTETASASIGIKKTLEVQPVVFKDSKGNLLANPKEIEKNISLLQETLAQAGILVKSKPLIVLDLPCGISLEDGLNAREQRKLARYTAKYQAPDKGIRMVFAGDHILSTDKESYEGRAVIQNYKRIIFKRHNAVLLSSQPSAAVPGHEVVHCLLGSVFGNKLSPYLSLDHDPKNPSHHNDYFNVMYETVSSNKTTGHLTNKQIEVILQSPLLKNPTPRIDLQKPHTTPVLAPAL